MKAKKIVETIRKINSMEGISKSFLLSTWVQTLNAESVRLDRTSGNVKFLDAYILPDKSIVARVSIDEHVSYEAYSNLQELKEEIGE